jgi:insertion element IS1 protein InsB
MLVKKKHCWIWIAVDRYSKRFLNFVIGNRDNETASKFWSKIEHHEMTYIASDHWKSYESIIPKEKHIQSKAETFTIEGYNSLFRHFLARMRRKSKCYSKKIDMLIISIKLLMQYRNKNLCIVR